MRGKTARILLVLILIFACLVTTAASCDPDPDPDGWPDGTKGWSAEEAIHATETYGALQWHAQLTEMAQP